MDIRKVVREDWEKSKMTYQQLSDKHGVPVGTLKSWKARDKKDGDEWLRASTKADKKRLQMKQVEKAVKKMSDDLNEKQKLFCLYYIKYFNATKAYQKAYGCSYTTAMSEGSKHTKKPKIMAEIDRLKTERLGSLMVDATSIIQRYIDIAFADINDFTEVEIIERPLLDEFGEAILDENGEPKIQRYNRVLIKESKDIDGSVVTGLSQGKDGVVLKLADQMKALEMLSKYADIFDERTKSTLQRRKLEIEIEQMQRDKGSKDGSDWTEAVMEVMKKRQQKNEEESNEEE